jgi:predicted molibdopterin-dependent oxidoreductase YjgC
MRIEEHPILGPLKKGKLVRIEVDGKPIDAFEGEPVAAALMAAGKTIFRYTRKRREARGVFCAIGQCTDCMMTVDGVPDVRTCITAVRDGMKIQTQFGSGEFGSTSLAIEKDAPK